jgi:hypothetical protein
VVLALVVVLVRAHHQHPAAASSCRAYCCPTCTWTTNMYIYD